MGISEFPPRGINGTGVSGRVAVWSGIDSMNSSASFTYNTATNELVSGGKVTTGSGNDCILNPDVADGASAISYTLDTLNTLSNAGAKLFSLKSNTVEKVSIGYDGSGIFQGDLTCNTLNYAALNPAISAGGSDTQVQYNNSGVFGGDANLTWDYTGQFLVVYGSATLQDTTAGNTTALIFPNSSGANNSLEIYDYSATASTWWDGTGKMWIDNDVQMSTGRTFLFDAPGAMSLPRYGTGSSSTMEFESKHGVPSAIAEFESKGGVQSATAGFDGSYHGYSGFPRPRDRYYDYNAKVYSDNNTDAKIYSDNNTDSKIQQQGGSWHVLIDDTYDTYINGTGSWYAYGYEDASGYFALNSGNIYWTDGTNENFADGYGFYTTNDGQTTWVAMRPDTGLEMCSDTMKITWGAASDCGIERLGAGSLKITDGGVNAGDMLADKLYLGEGADMGIYYDGTGGNIDTDLVAASDLNIDCGAGKTLVLEVPVYQDANVGSLVLQTGGTLPGIVEILDNAGAGTGVYTRGFAVNEQGSGSIEIPHDYSEGTNLVFHVHWLGNDAPTGTDKVKWQVAYTIMRDETTTPVVITDSAETDYDTQYESKRTDVETIVGTTLKIGDQINFTIKRIAASADEYGGEALVATIGVHYQLDTLGSRTITAK